MSLWSSSQPILMSNVIGFSRESNSFRRSVSSHGTVKVLSLMCIANLANLFKNESWSGITTQEAINKVSYSRSFSSNTCQGNRQNEEKGAGYAYNSENASRRKFVRFRLDDTN